MTAYAVHAKLKINLQIAYVIQWQVLDITVHMSRNLKT